MSWLPRLSYVLSVIASSLTLACSTQRSVVDLEFYALPGSLAHLSLPGPTPVDTLQGQRDSRWGGILTFTLFQPRGPTRGRLALAHGFLRSKETMVGWGAWLASHGWEVVIPSFIHSSLLGGNHDRNARDLADLADFLWRGQPRLYGGFSAGGLASVLAAAADPLALGWLGLDPVDSGGLALPALRVLVSRNLPALLVFAEPSSCNAQNNFFEQWNRAGGAENAVIRLPGAVHHAFEDPYDPGVDGLCGVMVPAGAVTTVNRWLRARVLEWLEALHQSP